MEVSFFWMVSSLINQASVKEEYTDKPDTPNQQPETEGE